MSTLLHWGLLVAGKDKLCMVCRWHLATTKRRYLTLKAPNVLYSGNLSGYGLAINASYDIGLIRWSDLAVPSHIPTMTYSAPHLQMSFPSETPKRSVFPRSWPPRKEPYDGRKYETPLIMQKPPLTLIPKALYLPNPPSPRHYRYGIVRDQ